ncbi:MAG: carboxypeptidase regulatory-like domain-containing protein, partial [Candidatus Acidiferrales bacterium]
MRISRSCVLLSAFVFIIAFAGPTWTQTITATLQGQVLDPSGGSIPKAKVTAVNKATGVTRTVETTSSGEYDLAAIPVGDYTVTAEIAGFQTQAKDVTLQVGETATLNFNLAVGEATEKVVVQATSEVTEPTRTQVSTVITQQQIQTLPVNGRQFIDFALLSPGVQIGDTTSGSTDVIVEPVTKLSFAGQNIHFNFIAVDGADDISTASGIQRGTPPQDSVREFRVINTDYTTEFGRATAGIVNI